MADIAAPHSTAVQSEVATSLLSSLCSFSFPSPSSQFTQRMSTGKSSERARFHSSVRVSVVSVSKPVSPPSVKTGGNYETLRERRCNSCRWRESCRKLHPALTKISLINTARRSNREPTQPSPVCQFAWHVSDAADPRTWVLGDGEACSRHGETGIGLGRASPEGA